MVYLEGQGGLVNRVTAGIPRVNTWVLGVNKLLTKRP